MDSGIAYLPLSTHYQMPLEKSATCTRARILPTSTIDTEHDAALSLLMLSESSVTAFSSRTTLASFTLDVLQPSSSDLYYAGILLNLKGKRSDNIDSSDSHARLRIQSLSDLSDLTSCGETDDNDAGNYAFEEEEEEETEEEDHIFKPTNLSLSISSLEHHFTKSCHSAGLGVICMLLEDDGDHCATM